MQAIGRLGWIQIDAGDPMASPPSGARSSGGERVLFDLRSAVRPLDLTIH